MGDLEGGTEGWNVRKGDLGRRTGVWNEIMGILRGGLGIGMGSMQTWRERVRI